jgi:hypothetical protein
VDSPIAQRCELLSAVHLDKENLNLWKLLAECTRAARQKAPRNLHLFRGQDTRILGHHDKADGEGKLVPVRVVVEESLHDRTGHRLPVESIEPQHFSDSSLLARRYPKLPHELTLFLFKMCHNFPLGIRVRLHIIMVIRFMIFLRYFLFPGRSMTRPSYFSIPPMGGLLSKTKKISTNFFDSTSLKRTFSFSGTQTLYAEKIPASFAKCNPYGAPRRRPKRFGSVHPGRVLRGLLFRTFSQRFASCAPKFDFSR